MAVDNKELMRGLYNAMGKFGDKWPGTSIIDQYRNANSGLDYLYDNAGDFRSEGTFDKIKSGLNGQKWQAVASGVATGISGLSGIADTIMQSTQLNDTSGFQSNINNLRNVGTYGYSSYDQLARDWADTDFNQTIDKRDIRGMNGLEKAGAIGSATLTGATAGLQIGGPWGAAVGAAVGFGGGLGGVLAGDAQARAKRDLLNTRSALASDAAIANLGVAHDYLGDRGARWREAHAVAMGGRIRRQNVDDIRNRMLGKDNPGSAPVRVTKMYCNGGVKIRVKK